MPRIWVTFQRVGSEAAPSLVQAMELDSSEEVHKRFDAGKHCYIGNAKDSLATSGWVTFGEMSLRVCTPIWLTRSIGMRYSLFVI